MSQKNFNVAGVPWYAKRETPPCRSKSPRQLPEEYKNGKIAKSQALRYIYNFIRANWKEGDRVVVVEGEIKDELGNLIRKSRWPGRTGIFVGLISPTNPQCGGPTMVQITWDHNKDSREKMGPVEFYYFAFHPEELEEKS